jgi:hypothetical protein
MTQAPTAFLSNPQGIVVAFVVDPTTGEFQEESLAFYSLSDNPISRAESVAKQFASGMKGWGKARKEFGQSVIDRGLTLKFVPIII